MATASDLFEELDVLDTTAWLIEEWFQTHIMTAAA